MQLEEEAYCQNPHCGAKIIIKSGHRRRKYCDNACKQAAHRAREADALRKAEEAARQASIGRERALLRKKYGNLLPESIDLLQAMPERASLIAKVIIAERESVRASQAQERNVLIEDLLLIGESLGFPILVNDDLALDEGIENWLSLCQEASLEKLYQTRDIAHIKLGAREARKRLAQFVPQS